MGDDVAALPVGRGMLLLTTDALSEGTHFLPTADPRAVGRATVAASLSDIASKGGRPIGVLIDLLLPPTTPMRWAQRVVEGAEALAVRYGCHVVGGDTKPARGRTVVGTIVGVAPRGRLPGRAGARPGDVLLVTGTVGRGGAAALPILTGRVPDARERRALLAIRPRLSEGRALARFATAMIDTSDGLADGARRLAHASRVRVVLDAEQLPIDPALRRLRPPRRQLEVAMYGGDYELLAAVPRGRVVPALRAVRTAGGRATAVGRIERGRGAFLARAGRRSPMPETGWDPFGSPRKRVRHAGTAHPAR
jgi:thiamine-monophosphate kinase